MDTANLGLDAAVQQLGKLQNLFQPQGARAGDKAESPGAKPGGPRPPVPAGDTAVFSSEYQSLAVRMEAVRQRIVMQQQNAGGQAGEGGGEDGAAASVAEQLSFSFAAEARYEEIALFQQRTENVAAGLDAPRGQALRATSQSISFRFQMSFEMSAESLRGFAGAAEGAAGAVDSDAAMDKLIGFAQDLLQRSTEMINEAFEAMGGFMKGFEEDFAADFQAMLDKFFQGLTESGFLGGGLDGLQELTGPAGQGGGVQSPYGGVPKGTTVSSLAAELKVQMEFEFAIQRGEVKESDPITLDLDGDGIELTSYSNGAQFDITGSGRAVQTAFVAGGDAFLAMDRNGNGTIDDGTELFGDQRGAANGYEELRKLDDNGDGVIDRKDKAFESLRLWKDNGNGRTERGELRTLGDEGVASLSVGYRNVDEQAAGGNRIAQRSFFTRNDGSQGRTADAILNYLA